MKRILIAALVLVAGIQLVEPAFAARRVVVRRTPRAHRTTVVVHRGWPLRRAPRAVIVRPARVPVRVAPLVFLSTVTFAAAVVSAPAPDVLVWEDGETLEKSDDWTEFTLNCDTRGEKLYLQVVSGKVQADWAEVVFENGDARVVDFEEKTHGPGLYALLDFADGRKVDHVRLVARAKSDQARVVLKMQK